MTAQQKTGAGDDGGVTILIPHFQTLEAIRICLRSIRKYTAKPVRVLVLDNGSKDESLDYLRSVAWIERVSTAIPNHIWQAHYLSLNEAVKRVGTAHFLVLHSDTFVHHADWLDFLFQTMQAGDCAAVGPRHQRIPVRTFWWLFFSRFRNWRVREFKPGVPIVRSFCTLYRTAPFRALGCAFHTRAKEDISYAANETLIRNGHRIYGIPASELSRYVFHASALTLISHARAAGGVVSLAGDSYLSAKIVRRSGRALRRFMELRSTRELLADSSLDQ